MLPTRRGAFQGDRSASWPTRLRSVAFSLLYGPGARVYDRFTDRLFLGEWSRWQETALPPLPAEGLVVELGAGTGRLATVGVSLGRRWLALEPSVSMLARARRRTRETGVWVVRGSADAIPVGDAVASAVVATFPTGYILDPAVAAEVSRVLAVDGRFVVVLDGELAPDGWRRRTRSLLLSLFYGAERGEEATALRFARFKGRTSAVATPHGRAMVYVGTPLGPRNGPMRTTLVKSGDCSTAQGETPNGYDRR